MSDQENEFQAAVIEKLSELEERIAECAAMLSKVNDMLAQQIAESQRHRTW